MNLMSCFLSACYFVPTNSRLAATSFGNMRYGFGGAPMWGSGNFFVRQPGRFRGWLQLQIEPNGVTYDAADCKSATNVRIGQILPSHLIGSTMLYLHFDNSVVWGLARRAAIEIVE